MKLKRENLYIGSVLEFEEIEEIAELGIFVTESLKDCRVRETRGKSSELNFR